MIDAPIRLGADVTVIPESPEANEFSGKIVAALRRANISGEMAYRGNAKRRFELAAKSKTMGRIIVTGIRNTTDGRQNHGLSIRVNQDLEAGDALIDHILEVLKPVFDIDGNSDTLASQLDTVIWLPKQ